MINPAFHFEILKDFQEIISDKIDILMEVLGKEAKNNKNLDIFEKVKAFSFDVICG